MKSMRTYLASVWRWRGPQIGEEVATSELLALVPTTLVSRQNRAREYPSRYNNDLLGSPIRPLVHSYEIARQELPNPPFGSPRHSFSTLALAY